MISPQVIATAVTATNRDAHALSRAESVLCAATLSTAVILWLWPSLARAAGTAEVAASALCLMAFLLLAAVTPVLASVDFAVHRLPNAIVLPVFCGAAVLFCAASVVSGQSESLIRSLIGCATLSVFYLLLVLIQPGGMGFGDVKLSAVLGLYLGWAGWGPLLLGGLSAFVLGGLVGLVMLALRHGSWTTAIPFGPWMLAGAWLGIAVGHPAMVA